jgi:hypothetical protein
VLQRPRSESSSYKLSISAHLQSSAAASISANRLSMFFRELPAAVAASFFAATAALLSE